MELLLKALPTIISAVCLGVMSWTAKKMLGVLKEFTVLKQSQQDQLKAAIVEKYEAVQERGYITPLSLDTVHRMADSYFALGGNTYVKALVKHMDNDMEIRGIPIPDEKE